MTCNKQTHSCAVLAALGLLIGSAAQSQDIPIALIQSSSEIGDVLSMPSDVSVGDKGRIYVIDGGNHQVAVFDTSGLRVATLGERGSEEGQFEEPVGIGVGRKGEIWVADKGNQRLQMFSADGRFREAIALEEDGDAIDPVDVAVSATGKELFATTNNTHRVVVFSNKGKYLRGWGGEGEDDGQFRYPATIDIDPAGNVLVVDVLNSRVQKFDAEGNFLLSFGKLGGKPGTFFRPKGIAVDSEGRSYVSDSYLGAIQVFDAEGQFLHALGEGGEATAYNTPVGMTADGSRLLVVQMLAGNVLVLEPSTEALLTLDPEAEAQE